MGIERHIVAMTIGVILGLNGAAVWAAPPEALVVTPLADPDPNFVPPAEPKHRGEKPTDGMDESSSVEQAIQDFGRIIGRAAVVEQQQIDARCRAGMSSGHSLEGRFAWEASCRYSRY